MYGNAISRAAAVNECHCQLISANFKGSRPSRCECCSCKADAVARSQQIDLEIMEEAKSHQLVQFSMLLGYRDATDKVSKTLLCLNNVDLTGEEIAARKNQIVHHAREVARREVASIKEAVNIRETVYWDTLTAVTSKIENWETLNLDEMSFLKTCSRKYYREHDSTSRDHSTIYFLNNLPRLTSPLYYPTLEDFSNLPLHNSASIFHTKHTLPDAYADNAQAITLNIISRPNGNSRSKKYYSCFTVAKSFIYVIDLKTCGRGLVGHADDSRTAFEEFLGDLKNYIESDRFKDGMNFVWVVDTTRYGNVVEPSGESCEQFFKQEQSEKVEEGPADILLLKLRQDTVERDNLHVFLIEEVNMQNIQHVLDEMTEILTSTKPHQGKNCDY